MLATRMMMAVAASVDHPTISSSQHWYRADLGRTGDPVTGWADQVGSWNLAATNGPDYQATAGPKSTPIFVFDGTNDIMGIGSQTTLAQPVHAMLIMKQVAWGANKIIFGDDSSSPAPYIVQNTSASPVIRLNPGGGEGVTEVSPTLGTFFLVNAFFNGGSSYVRLNDAATPAASGSGTAGLNAGLSLGGQAYAATPSNWTNIAVAEMEIFNAEVTGSDLTDILAYYSDRYGLW